MDLGLTDKVAIVTGSSRGLGLASARALVAEGCRVCVCARGAERLAEAAIEVEAAARRPNMVLAVQADVSTTAGVELVIDRTIETFGGLDILVNNVGRAAGSGLLETSDADWQAAFDETLFPAIRASRLAVPHLKQRGGGAIIMITSIFGRETGGRMTYNAVKAAEISLSKSLAQQLAPLNIRVNNVAPGSIALPRWLLARPSTSRSRRHRGVHPPRPPIRTIRPSRRSRPRRRIPRLTPSKLGQWRVGGGRWVSEPVEYLTSETCRSPWFVVRGSIEPRVRTVFCERRATSD